MKGLLPINGAENEMAENVPAPPTNNTSHLIETFAKRQKVDKGNPWKVSANSTSKATLIEPSIHFSPQNAPT